MQVRQTFIGAGPICDGIIRLLVVDDHSIVRQGIAAILADTEIQIVGEAGTAEEAIMLAAKLQPNIVLLDVRLAGQDGLQALSAIRDSALSARVIVFTAVEEPGCIARASCAGARGYILKGASQSELVNAIRLAHTGFPLSDISLIAKPLNATFRHWERQVENTPLTHRELQVLRLVALGRTNAEISQMIAASPDAVKMDVEKLIHKLAARDRTGAAIWAARNGLV